MATNNENSDFIVITEHTTDCAVNNTDAEFINKGQFTLEELYTLCLKFFKEKEGSRALQISYKDKQHLIALTKQVTYGPYKGEYLPSIGLFDVIGNDRRLAWSNLGEMSKTEAMQGFIDNLQSLSPLVEPYLEAHRTKRKEEKKKLEEEKKREELNKRCLEEAKQQQEAEQMRTQMEELQIRNALNQQTAIQFKVYAEQQYPNDLQQQQVLIRQLQEQHFIQYMQKLYQHHQQLLELQQQYFAQQQQSSSQQHQQQYQQQENRQVVTSEQQQQDSAATTDAAVQPMKEVMLQNGGRELQVSDEDLPPIAAASMWVRKDVKEFKQALSKEQDSIIKVGSGEMVTIRVPTHDDGSCLFWEFSTEHYDIGFGVFFEWSSAKDITVHVNESTDDDDDDFVADKSSSKDDPVEEIIPVYRRDSHLEIQCGSHIYPGRGVYLLKFDNSYSLWRTKTLYYRVYYTK